MDPTTAKKACPSISEPSFFLLAGASSLSHTGEGFFLKKERENAQLHPRRDGERPREEEKVTIWKNFIRAIFVCARMHFLLQEKYFWCEVARFSKSEINYLAVKMADSYFKKLKNAFELGLFNFLRWGLRGIVSRARKNNQCKT